MTSRQVVHVVGARPNYMKIAPIYASLAERGSVEQRLIHTGQHYDARLNDVFFSELPLPRPHIELGIGSGSHAEQTARALEGLEGAFLELRPDLVVVPGDVNSTLAAALAAAKLGMAVCHVEAGLRSFDRSMPEEHNRRLTDHVSTLLLTHSASANDNLAAEGIAGDMVEFIGNTMIDTLFAQLDAAQSLRAYERYGLESKGYLLVTLHRPTLVDDDGLLQRTMEALLELAETIPIVFPVHPRTAGRLGRRERASGRLDVVPPLGYREFLSLEADALAVITDSGGVQEETTALGVPCFTLRETTERPVTITHGTNTVLGLMPEAVLDVPRLLADQPSNGFPELWDGHAGERAAAAIEHLLASVDSSLPA